MFNPTNINPAPEFQPLSVDVKTAAHMIGVPESMIRKLMRTGELVAVYIGSKPVLTITELEAYLTSLTSKQKMTFH